MKTVAGLMRTLTMGKYKYCKECGESSLVIAIHSITKLCRVCTVKAEDKSIRSISSDFKYCKECRRKTKPCKICQHNLDVIQRLESKGKELALKLLEKDSVG